MAKGIKYSVLTAIAIVLTSCVVTEPSLPPILDIQPEETPYFTLRCMRYALDTELNWYCVGEPSTEILQGQMTLRYQDEKLTFAWYNFTLNSGNDFLDAYIGANSEIGILDMPPEFGDFGWSWSEDAVLVIRWTEDKTFVLDISYGDHHTWYEVPVYYRTGQGQDT